MDVLYHDTYSGPRWSYGLTYRPLGLATVPKGWIVFSHRQDPRFAFGVLDWPRELTPDEIEAFELVWAGHDCGAEGLDHLEPPPELQEVPS